jgi:hypothetical protein
MKLINSVLTKIKFLCTLTLLLINLSCSLNSEPSESDIYRAVVEFTNSDPVARVFDVRIISTKKLSCTQVGSNEYICLVQGVVRSNIIQNISETERYRFLRTDAGWKMLENLH